MSNIGFSTVDGVSLPKKIYWGSGQHLKAFQGRSIAAGSAVYANALAHYRLVNHKNVLVTILHVIT